MSASTPQNSTTLDNYDFAHNPPIPQSNQHNRGVSSFSPSALTSAFRMLDPNTHSSSVSSQHIATTSDVHAVIPAQMANPKQPIEQKCCPAWFPAYFTNLRLRSYGKGLLVSACIPNAETNRPHFARVLAMRHDHLGCVFRRTYDGKPHSYNTSSAALWTPDNPGPAVSHGPSQSVPYLHDLEGTSLRPIGHTLLASSQRGMTASDMHSAVPMMANPNAVSWTPGNLRTAVSHDPSQSVRYHLHDLGGISASFQLPPAQSGLPMSQPSPLLCRNLGGFKTALA
ncbi:hypothetical protein DFJ58DRAFT_841292 [Suillus subalutaceus]|uniref:uncharacterized protein n=1 Tax=Suillus subalutaceus TaxID=48586 RepID=UPI001B86FA8C|nr:uncharacterized protein DFJ58DRAFT_841292 [Suillus subalutaceus]KAG1854810.1 hypothetical protein DFJ58DRAFT_841292 [Suillus subalutaceus]